MIHLPLPRRGFIRSKGSSKFCNDINSIDLRNEYMKTNTLHVHISVLHQYYIALLCFRRTSVFRVNVMKQSQRQVVLFAKRSVQQNTNTNMIQLFFVENHSLHRLSCRVCLCFAFMLYRKALFQETVYIVNVDSNKTITIFHHNNKITKKKEKKKYIKQN